MKNTNFSRCVKLWVAALVLVCGVAFTGCKPGVDKPALPAGVKELSADSMLIETWVDAGSWGNSYYELSYDSFRNYGDYGTPESAYEGYEGNSIVTRKLTNDTGYLYMKYTKAMNPDYSYSTEAPDVGKWYAVYYKIYSSESISLLGAWGSKEGHKVSSTATLEEAINEFTVENGYFGSPYPLAKVK